MDDFRHPMNDANEPTNPPSAAFWDASEDLGLNDYVQETTRWRDQNHPSLLDLVFTNEPLMIGSVELLNPLSRNDHAVLKFGLIY
ncbi:hypothetical protein EG68_00265 [Paragonimus skrjabini miyazakii]|uniref:Endonuclease/exonuclease/phosphatase domain-containing protein n=1 Tax=Paragonimus skrjabini miyazakii TaxID=59628 RepID=A0A8S9Z4R3_9TREM|nr:hypothetical protein EG68_00265 [Paragonimus skrjabini miyazakii]